MNWKIIMFNIRLVFQCKEMSTEIMPAIEKVVILFIPHGLFYYFVSDGGIHALLVFCIIC